MIDGGVRDITEIQAHGFPVFSTMIALRGAGKTKAGTVQAPIHCGGVLVEPGDWVVGDSDGVVVVPGATIADVINAGRVRAAKEAGMFRALSGREDDGRAARPRCVPDPRGRDFVTNVLIATDGSEIATLSAKRAGELLGSVDSVTVLSIVTDLPGDDAGGIEGSAQTPEDAQRMLEREEHDASAAIDAVVAALPESWRPKVKRRVEAGDAGPMIVWVAEHEHSDLIVAGSHGRGALKRLVMGSVSTHVTHHAHLPRPPRPRPRRLIRPSRTSPSTLRPV